MGIHDFTKTIWKGKSFSIIVELDRHSELRLDEDCKRNKILSRFATIVGFKKGHYEISIRKKVVKK